MAKNGWTKEEVLALCEFDKKKGYEIRCQGDLISGLCIYDPAGLDLWEQGEGAWKDENDEDMAGMGSPTFTFDGDRYSIVQYIEDYKKSDIKVFKTKKPTEVKWQKSQVTVE